MHWAHSRTLFPEQFNMYGKLKIYKLLFESQRPITEFVQTKSADWRTRSDKPMKMNKYRIYNRHMCIQITVQTKQNIINFNKLQCALYGEKNIHKYYKQKKKWIALYANISALSNETDCFSLSITYTNEKEINRKIINCMFWFCYPQYPNN